MSGRGAAGLLDAATNTAKKGGLPDLPPSLTRNSGSLPQPPTPSGRNIDGSSVAGKNTNDALAATKRAELDNLKNLETPELTKQFGDTIKKSSFYQKNQGKLLALGLTVATLSAWYGTLRAMGLSHQEALDKMAEDTGSAAATLGGSIFEGIWTAFVVFVHNTVGFKWFDEQEGTARALKVLIAVIVVLRLSNLVGINIFSMIFRSRKK